jgi:hypothetical protein
MNVDPATQFTDLHLATECFFFLGDLGVLAVLARSF